MFDPFIEEVLSWAKDMDHFFNQCGVPISVTGTLRVLCGDYPEGDEERCAELARAWFEIAQACIDQTNTMATESGGIAQDWQGGQAAAQFSMSTQSLSNTGLELSQSAQSYAQGALAINNQIVLLKNTFQWTLLLIMFEFVRKAIQMFYTAGVSLALLAAQVGGLRYALRQAVEAALARVSSIFIRQTTTRVLSRETLQQGKRFAKDRGKRLWDRMKHPLVYSAARNQNRSIGKILAIKETDSALSRKGAAEAVRWVKSKQGRGHVTDAVAARLLNRELPEVAALSTRMRQHVDDAVEQVTRQGTRPLIIERVWGFGVVSAVGFGGGIDALSQLETNLESPSYEYSEPATVLAVASAGLGGAPLGLASRLPGYMVTGAAGGVASVVTVGTIGELTSDEPLQESGGKTDRTYSSDELSWNQIGKAAWDGAVGGAWEQKVGDAGFREIRDVRQQLSSVHAAEGRWAAQYISVPDTPAELTPAVPAADSAAANPVAPSSSVASGAAPSSSGSGGGSSSGGAAAAGSSSGSAAGSSGGTDGSGDSGTDRAQETGGGTAESAEAARTEGGAELARASAANAAAQGDVRAADSAALASESAANEAARAEVGVPETGSGSGSVDSAGGGSDSAAEGSGVSASDRAQGTFGEDQIGAWPASPDATAGDTQADLSGTVVAEEGGPTESGAEGSSTGDDLPGETAEGHAASLDSDGAGSDEKSDEPAASPDSSDTSVSEPDASEKDDNTPAEEKTTRAVGHSYPLSGSRVEPEGVQNTVRDVDLARLGPTERLKDMTDRGEVEVDPETWVYTITGGNGAVVQQKIELADDLPAGASETLPGEVQLTPEGYQWIKPQVVRLSTHTFRNSHDAKIFGLREYDRHLSRSLVETPVLDPNRLSYSVGRAATTNEYHHGDQFQAAPRLLPSENPDATYASVDDGTRLKKAYADVRSTGVEGVPGMTGDPTDGIAVAHFAEFTDQVGTDIPFKLRFDDALEPGQRYLRPNKWSHFGQVWVAQEAAVITVSARSSPAQMREDLRSGLHQLHKSVPGRGEWPHQLTRNDVRERLQQQPETIKSFDVLGHFGPDGIEEITGKTKAELAAETAKRLLGPHDELSENAINEIMFNNAPFSDDVFNELRGVQQSAQSDSTSSAESGNPAAEQDDSAEGPVAARNESTEDAAAGNAKAGEAAVGENSGSAEDADGEASERSSEPESREQVEFHKRSLRKDYTAVLSEMARDHFTSRGPSARQHLLAVLDKMAFGELAPRDGERLPDSVTVEANTDDGILLSVQYGSDKFHVEMVVDLELHSGEVRFKPPEVAPVNGEIKETKIARASVSARLPERESHQEAVVDHMTRQVWDQAGQVSDGVGDISDPAKALDWDVKNWPLTNGIFNAVSGIKLTTDVPIEQKDPTKDVHKHAAFALLFPSEENFAHDVEKMLERLRNSGFELIEDGYDDGWPKNNPGIFTIWRDPAGAEIPIRLMSPESMVARQHVAQLDRQIAAAAQSRDAGVNESQDTAAEDTTELQRLTRIREEVLHGASMPAGTDNIRLERGGPSTEPAEEPEQRRSWFTRTLSPHANWLRTTMTAKVDKVDDAELSLTKAQDALSNLHELIDYRAEWAKFLAVRMLEFAEPDPDQDQNSKAALLDEIAGQIASTLNLSHELVRAKIALPVMTRGTDHPVEASSVPKPLGLPERITRLPGSEVLAEAGRFYTQLFSKRTWLEKVVLAEATNVASVSANAVEAIEAAKQTAITRGMSEERANRKVDAVLESLRTKSDVAKLHEQITLDLANARTRESMVPDTADLLDPPPKPGRFTTAFRRRFAPEKQRVLEEEILPAIEIYEEDRGEAEINYRDSWKELAEAIQEFVDQDAATARGLAEPTTNATRDMGTRFEEDDSTIPSGPEAHETPNKTYEQSENRLENARKDFEAKAQKRKKAQEEYQDNIKSVLEKGLEFGITLLDLATFARMEQKDVAQLLGRVSAKGTPEPSQTHGKAVVDKVLQADNEVRHSLRRFRHDLERSDHVIGRAVRRVFKVVPDSSSDGESARAEVSAKNADGSFDSTEESAKSADEASDSTEESTKNADEASDSAEESVTSADEEPDANDSTSRDDVTHLYKRVEKIRLATETFDPESSTFANDLVGLGVAPDVAALLGKPLPSYRFVADIHKHANSYVNEDFVKLETLLQYLEDAGVEGRILEQAIRELVIGQAQASGTGYYATLAMMFEANLQNTPGMLELQGKFADVLISKLHSKIPPHLQDKATFGSVNQRWDIPGARGGLLATLMVLFATVTGEQTGRKEVVQNLLGEQENTIYNDEWIKFRENIRKAAGIIQKAINDGRIDHGLLSAEWKRVPNRPTSSNATAEGEYSLEGEYTADDDEYTVEVPPLQELFPADGSLYGEDYGRGLTPSEQLRFFDGLYHRPEEIKSLLRSIRYTAEADALGSEPPSTKYNPHFIEKMEGHRDFEILALLHHDNGFAGMDINGLMVSNNPDERGLVEYLALMRDRPDLKNVKLIWAHLGVGNWTNLTVEHLDFLDQALRENPGLHFDFSWSPIGQYLNDDAVRERFIQFVRDYQDRLLYGSDTIKAEPSEHYIRPWAEVSQTIKEIGRILGQNVVWKITRGNYERMVNDSVEAGKRRFVNEYYSKYDEWQEYLNELTPRRQREISERAYRLKYVEGRTPIPANAEGPGRWGENPQMLSLMAAANIGDSDGSAQYWKAARQVVRDINDRWVAERPEPASEPVDPKDLVRGGLSPRALAATVHARAAYGNSGRVDQVGGLVNKVDRHQLAQDRTLKEIQATVQRRNFIGWSGGAAATTGAIGIGLTAGPGLTHALSTLGGSAFVVRGMLANSKLWHMQKIRALTESMIERERLDPEGMAELGRLVGKHLRATLKVHGATREHREKLERILNDRQDAFNRLVPEVIETYTAVVSVPLNVKAGETMADRVRLAEMLFSRLSDYLNREVYGASGAPHSRTLDRVVAYGTPATWLVNLANYAAQIQSAVGMQLATSMAYGVVALPFLATTMPTVWKGWDGAAHPNLRFVNNVVNWALLTAANVFLTFQYLGPALQDFLLSGHTFAAVAAASLTAATAGLTRIGLKIEGKLGRVPTVRGPELQYRANSALMGLGVFTLSQGTPLQPVGAIVAAALALSGPAVKWTSRVWERLHTPKPGWRYRVVDQLATDSETRTRKRATGELPSNEELARSKKANEKNIEHLLDREIPVSGRSPTLLKEYNDYVAVHSSGEFRPGRVVEVTTAQSLDPTGQNASVAGAAKAANVHTSLRMLDSVSLAKVGVERMTISPEGENSVAVVRFRSGAMARVRFQSEQIRNPMVLLPDGRTAEDGLFHAQPSTNGAPAPPVHVDLAGDRSDLREQVLGALGHISDHFGPATPGNFDSNPPSPLVSSGSGGSGRTGSAWGRV